MRNIITLLCLFHLDGLEFFHLPVLAMNTFFFYFFEWINNLGWIVFILHLTVATNSEDMTPSKIKSVKRKEIVLLIILVFVIIP